MANAIETNAPKFEVAINTLQGVHRFKIHAPNSERAQEWGDKQAAELKLGSTYSVSVVAL